MIEEEGEGKGRKRENLWDAVCAQKGAKGDDGKKGSGGGKMWEGRDQKKTQEIMTIPLEEVRDNA